MRRLGTEIFNIDSICIKSPLRDTRSLLDFVQDDHEILNIAVQKVEGFVDWESHGLAAFLSATVVVAAHALKGMAGVARPWYRARHENERGPNRGVVCQPRTGSYSERGGERETERTGSCLGWLSERGLGGCTRGAEALTSTAAIVASFVGDVGQGRGRCFNTIASRFAVTL